MTTRVEPSWFHDGTLLEHLASTYMQRFARVLVKGGPHGVVRGRLTWGSLCSGSEGAHFVMQTCAVALPRTALGAASQTAFGQGAENELIMEQVFACENDQEKQKWIDFVINTDRRAEGRDLICIFRDIKDMGKIEAYCWTHKKMRGARLQRPLR